MDLYTAIILSLLIVAAGLGVFALARREWGGPVLQTAINAVGIGNLAAVPVEIRAANGTTISTGPRPQQVIFAPQPPIIIGGWANPYTGGGNAPVYQQPQAAPYPIATPPVATGAIPTPVVGQSGSAGSPVTITNGTPDLQVRYRKVPGVWSGWFPYGTSLSVPGDVAPGDIVCAEFSRGAQIGSESNHWPVV